MLNLYMYIPPLSTNRFHFTFIVRTTREWNFLVGSVWLSFGAIQVDNDQVPSKNP